MATYALAAGLLAGASTTALAAAPAPAAQPAAADPAPEVGELVVTADPAQYQNQVGHAAGDVAPLLQLGPAEIQSYGVASVTALLAELAPQTASVGARAGGGQPITLLSGRRISGQNEIRDIPTEAILRVDILPEATALSYGYAADQKVVNFVLRPAFRAITLDGQAGGPTEGGQEDGQAEAGLFRVNGETRTNLDLKYQASTALTEAARGLAEPSPGLPFATLGNVAAVTPGGQIDPALSALAGQPVTVAGIPAPSGRPLSLADFAGTANAPNSGDEGRYRTLSPATQQVSANLVLSRPLPARFSGTINATLEATTSDSRQGLPSLSLVVPAGDPFSPFGSAVQVDRYVDALGPLRQSTNGWTGHLGGTLNRDAGLWRFSLTGAYDHADSATAGDVGLDPTAMQALLNAGSTSFNPFAAPPTALLTRLARSTVRSLADTANVQFLANGPLLKVPAGSLNVSFKMGDTQSAFSARSLRFGLAQAADLSRNDFNAQLHIDLPLASRRRNFLPAIGELSVNLNLATDRLSDFGGLRALGYGANWSPVQGINLNLSYTRDQGAPTVQQLGNPVIVTPGVRLFDFATGQTVQVSQVAGGNAALARDGRRLYRAILSIKPWAKRNLTFSGNYFDVRYDNPIASFPAATAAIEAAFPDRFVRDAASDLTSVDYRPVNFASQERRGLNWGFNWSVPIRGPPAPPRPGANAQAAANPLGPQIGQFQIAAYDTVFFTDQILVRPGGPLLDRLAGAAAGGAGGQPQHQVQVQAGYTLRGLGARMSLNWNSPTTVVGAAGSAGTLNFSDLATANLRLFADFGQMRTLVKARPWVKGARLTLSVNNLTDARIRVRDGTGATPLSYQPAYLDPTGRSITLDLRKLF